VAAGTFSCRQHTSLPGGFRSANEDDPILFRVSRRFPEKHFAWSLDRYRTPSRQFPTRSGIEPSNLEIAPVTSQIELGRSPGGQVDDLVQQP
jgi:hypothetical protein